MQNVDLNNKTIKRLYCDGSEEIKKVYYTNEKKEYKKKDQKRNTAQKRFRRAKDRLLAFESLYFVTLTVPFESKLRYDSRKLLKLADKFFKSEGVRFTGILEAYPENMGFHIHALVDQKVNLIKWKIMTNANLKDCYCKRIRDRLASANYILKNISTLPNNMRHCITNVATSKSAYQVELNDEIVFQNKEARLEQVSQAKYFSINYDDTVFKLTKINQNNTLASANIVIKDFHNLYFKCTNIKKHEQYDKSLNEINIINSNMLYFDTLRYTVFGLNRINLNTLNLHSSKHNETIFNPINQLFKQTTKDYLNSIKITIILFRRLSLTFHASDLNFLRPP